jgi:hypothetical protein
MVWGGTITKLTITHFVGEIDGKRARKGNAGPYGPQESRTLHDPEQN